jgi:HAD superfamily hydrolase (TIGR01548 family)
MTIKLDVLVFDIDGVLIDVSESYRNAARQTVQMYLETCLGLPPCSEDLVSHEDVAEFKLVGGFNNDWDLTTAILKYFLTRFDPQPAVHFSPEANSADVLSFLHEAGSHIDTTVEAMRQHKDILAFTQTLKTVGTGLDAVQKVLGEQNDHLLFAHGDLRGTNLAQRIFQELYLGEAFFRREYGEAPLIYIGPGLIQRERLIISPQILAELATRMPLGIATGRPRSEAIYGLETANVFNRFRSLVAFEDSKQSEQNMFQETGQYISLDKPHPFTLLEAVRRMTSERVRCAYIGDTPDDVRAANAAKKEMDFVSIGCLFATQEKDTLRTEFERAGADIIVNHPNELLSLIS